MLHYFHFLAFSFCFFHYNFCFCCTYQFSFYFYSFLICYFYYRPIFFRYCRCSFSGSSSPEMKLPAKNHRWDTCFLLQLSVQMAVILNQFFNTNSLITIHKHLNIISRLDLYFYQEKIWFGTNQASIFCSSACICASLFMGYKRRRERLRSLLSAISGANVREKGYSSQITG